MELPSGTRVEDHPDGHNGVGAGAAHHAASDVVVLEPAGRRIVTYGSPAKSDPRRLDGDTIFEIGSISKVFTALFLTDAARQEVALTDPVAKYLPRVSHVTIAMRSSSGIRLR